MNERIKKAIQRALHQKYGPSMTLTFIDYTAKFEDYFATVSVSNGKTTTIVAVQTLLTNRGVQVQIFERVHSMFVP